MRSTITFLAAIALVAAAIAPLSAQSNPLTLDGARARALLENPDLRIFRLRSDSSRAEVGIARSYANPELAITPNNPWQYSVAVPLDIGPQRTFRVRAANEGALAAAQDVRDTERQVRFAVSATFYDLLLADTLRQLAREQHEIFRDLLTADSSRVRAGDVPEGNLVKSELELAKSGADLARADAAVRAARLALQAAMGIARPDTGLRVEGSLAIGRLPAFDVAASDSLIAERPDVRAAHVRTQASVASRRLATSLLLPAPALLLVQQREEPFPNGQHYAVGVSAQIPVWNWFSGERARAEASVRQSQVSEDRVRVQAYAEVIAALDEFHADEQLARALDAGLLAKARTALETARFAYASGATSYVELLDAVRTYVEIRTDAANAAHDYWVSTFAVDRALDREVVRP